MFLTMLNQLTKSAYGVSRLKSMIGAKDFIISEEEKYIQFKFMSGAKNKANRIRVTLNKNDLYNVKFYTVRKFNEVSKGEYTDVYFDDLYTLFTEKTGLELEL